jgi:predicted Fe-Mo cluster-binding NifX family protein
MSLKKENKLENVERQEDTSLMDRIKIAIPCTGEASLQSQVSSHFGRCDSYAIVTLEKGEVKTIDSILNGGHSDCASPVRALAEKGVSLMLVGGMGMRPYLVFKQLGIEIRCGITGTVSDAIDSYLRGETYAMTQDSLCGQHTSANGSCHHQ